MAPASSSKGLQRSMEMACSFFLVLLLATTCVTARGLPTPLRGLAQAATDVVPAVNLAAPIIDPAAAAATAATAVPAGADLVPANALPAPATIDPATTATLAPVVTPPVAAADPAVAQPSPASAATAADPLADPLTVAAATAEAVPTAQATAAVVSVEASDLADVPPPDAVTQGVAADNTMYVPSPAVGPVRRRHSTSKKLYLYAWCGVTYANMTNTSPQDNDYIATIDATPGSSNYGKILNIANTPYIGTEAHHCNVDKSGKWLAAGGLLSVLYPNTADIFMFDLSNPARPQYKYGLTGTLGSCVDEFVAHKSGGFVATAMCGRDGHPGGGVIRIPDPSKAKMYEYTGGVTGADLASHASHGVDIDYSTSRMVTADYLDVASALSDLKVMHTASVWDTTSWKVLKKVNLTSITDGLMEARFSGKPGLFWVSGGLGKLHLINSKTFAKTPNVYCLGANCEDVQGTCLTTDTFVGPRGRRMLVTSMSLGQMRLIDVSDPYKLKTLDTYQLTGVKPGAHVVKFDTNTWTTALATYLLDIPGTVDAIRFQSDQTVRLFYIDLTKDKIVPKDGSKGLIDFKTAVPSKGPGNCHGLAFNYV